MKRLLISLIIACAVLCGLPPAAQAAESTVEIPVTGGQAYKSDDFHSNYALIDLSSSAPPNQFQSLFDWYGSWDGYSIPSASNANRQVYVYNAHLPFPLEHNGDLTIGGLIGLMGMDSYYGPVNFFDLSFSNLSRGFSYAKMDDGSYVLSDGLSLNGNLLPFSSAPLINSHATTFLTSVEFQSYFQVSGTVTDIGYVLMIPSGVQYGESSVKRSFLAYDNFYYTYDPDTAFQGGVLAILGDIWDTITYIPGQILEGMAQVVSGIIDGLTYMFFPPDDFMLEVWEDVTTDFEDQFGAIGYTVNYVIDLLEDLNPENRPGFGSHDDEFYFPGINLEIPIFGHSYYFKIDDGWIKCFPEGLEEYQEKVKFLVTAAFCLAAMTGWIRLYEARLGIDSDFDGDEEG